jgi:signal transduction histidine kinase/CheY-like chemotaxis protein
MMLNARRLIDPFEERQSILLSIEDITERKHLADELAKHSQQLAENDTAKNHFIAVLSHELRSPVNTTVLWSQILQRPGRSEEQLRKGLEVIDRCSRAQAKLIEDLLDVHRISSGALRLELAWVDFAEIVGLVLDSLAPSAKENGIRIVREFDATTAHVSGDSARLQQIIGNLIGNSIKFTPAGGVIRVVLQRKNARVVVKVIDTGEGISAAGLPHIFEGFQHADPLTTRSKGGLGLGLAIARQLVQLHGGSITAESPGKGGGATLTVSLPLVKEHPPARPLVPEAVATRRKSSRLSGVLVLVVEDELDAREVVRLVLEDAGARVLVAGSTDEALEIFRGQQPDVLLSDIGLPVRDGYDLMRSLRALPPEQGGRTPAIALTAFASAEDRARALEVGFQVHLAKPLVPEKLIAAIAALVAEVVPALGERAKE